MTSMYSLPDLSRATEVSESTVRRYAKTFAEYFPCEGRGRLKAYKEDCLDVVRRIKELFDAGYSTEQVRDILSGEFARIYEVEAPDSARGNIEPVPGAHELMREFVSAIQRNTRTEDEVYNLRQAVKSISSYIKQIRSSQEALPSSKDMDHVLARLDRLEKRVAMLEDKERSWWRRLLGG